MSKLPESNKTQHNKQYDEGVERLVELTAALDQFVPKTNLDHVLKEFVKDQINIMNFRLRGMGKRK